MYNKVILENLGEPFEIKYDGRTHKVPSGKFEAEKELGDFIHYKSNLLGRKINKLTQPEAPKVESIKEEKEEEVKEEKKEEKKVEKKKK